MLTKQEWVKKYVYKWKGVRNSDTGKIEYGYLLIWNEDHTVAEGKKANTRGQAIAQHYDLYAKAAALSQPGEKG